MGNAVAAAPELADFVGGWRLERRIEDVLAGETWGFAGRASFTPGADGLEYVEGGTLTGPGGRMLRAERRYFWRAGDGGLEVAFADGAPFHGIPAGQLRPTAEHLCGRDSYYVLYDFTAWPRWQAVWRVRGPRKDYVLHSSYSR